MNTVAQLVRLTLGTPWASEVTPLAKDAPAPLASDDVLHSRSIEPTATSSASATVMEEY